MDSDNATDWELQRFTPPHSHYLHRSIAAAGQGRKPNLLLTPASAWVSQARTASPAAHTPGLEYYSLLCPVTNDSYDVTETFCFGVEGEEKYIFITTSGK